MPRSSFHPVIERWFGAAEPDHKLPDYIGSVDRGAAEWLTLAVEAQNWMMSQFLHGEKGAGASPSWG